MKLFSIAFILLVALASYGLYLYRRHKKAAFYEPRESLTEGEIFQRYYSKDRFNQRDVLDLWKEVASVFRIPYGKLRPADRFGKELRGYWVVDNEVDELTDRAYQRLKKKGKHLDFKEISTLDDYVRLMLSALSEPMDNISGEK